MSKNVIKQEFFSLYGGMSQITETLNNRAAIAKKSSSDAVANVVEVVYFEHKPGKDGMFEGLAVVNTYWVK